MLQAVVNYQRDIDANTLNGKADRITFEGCDSGTVKVGGTLQASVQTTHGNGGVIEAKGATVETQLGTQVNTLSSNGKAGTLKVRSNEITVQP